MLETRGVWGYFAVVPSTVHLGEFADGPCPPNYTTLSYTILSYSIPYCPNFEQTMQQYEQAPAEFSVGHAHRRAVQSHEILHRTPQGDEAVARPESVV